MLTFMYSDSTVVRKVLQGNQGLFRVLVSRYGGVVHSIAYAYLRNATDAEDVAQETFTRFYQQLDRMAHYNRVGPWLVNVARNISVDLIRKRGRESAFARQSAEARNSRGEMPDPMREELHRLLWEQLDSLDEEAREVLILHYFMRKKAREIGGLLGISPDAAAKRVQRARDDLGRRLTDLIGEEVGEAGTDARRTEKIMAAICATPVVWKGSAAGAAAAATAVGVATGASAGKVAAVLAVIAILGLGGYFAYDWSTRPYSTQTVKAQSSISEKKKAGRDEAVAGAEGRRQAEDRRTQDDTAGTDEETRQAAPQDTEIAAGVVRGVVTTEDGTPLARATVKVNNQDEFAYSEQAQKSGNLSNMVPFLEYTTTTNGAGAYEIRGVCLATARLYFPRYQVIAKKGNLYGKEFLYGFKHLEPEVTQDIVVHADMSIGGKVVDLQGRPLQSAVVVCWDEPQEQMNIGQDHTKEDGTFLIEHLRAGIIYVSAVPRGYLPQKFVPITAGTMDYVFKMDPVNVVSGRVINLDTGECVPNAYIGGFSDSPDWQKNMIAGKTDETGKFQIGVCYPGTYVLNVQLNGAQNMALIEPTSITVTGGPVSGLELKVGAGMRTYGLVIDDETGAPVAEQFQVKAVQATTPPRTQSYAMVKQDGSYEMIGMTAGTFLIKGVSYFNLWGSGSNSPRDGGRITIGPGEKEKQHDIHLARRALLTGRVVDERGDPVTGASVYAANKEGTRLFGDTVSGMTGEFQIGLGPEHAPEDVYVQAKSGNGYSGASGPYSGQTGQAGILLEIATSGTLEGELVDRQGRPVDEAIVAAIPETVESNILYASRDSGQSGNDNGQSLRTNAEPGGTFHYESLRPGTYTLEVYLFSSPPNLPLARSTVTIEGGRTTTARLEINTEGFGSITGRVTFGGKPAEGTSVFINPAAEEWTTDHRETTDADGMYYAEHVLAGPVKLTVFLWTDSGAAGSRYETTDVVAGNVSTVNFDFAAGDASLEGYVLYNGAAPGQGHVLLEPVDKPGAGGPQVDMDGTGYYRLDNVAAGIYNVQARLGRREWALVNKAQSTQVELVSGKTMRLDIDLSGGSISGVVSGLKADQMGFVALFPGTAQLSEWSIAALESLGDQMLADTRAFPVQGKGQFEFMGIPPGDYAVAAAAIPSRGNVTTMMFLTAPVTTGMVHVEAGAVSEMELTFE